MLLLSSPLSIHWRRVVGEVRRRHWASVPGEKTCLNLGSSRNIGQKMSYMYTIRDARGRDLHGKPLSRRRKQQRRPVEGSSFSQIESRDTNLSHSPMRLSLANF